MSFQLYDDEEFVKGYPQRIPFASNLLTLPIVIPRFSEFVYVPRRNLWRQIIIFLCIEMSLRGLSTREQFERNSQKTKFKKKNVGIGALD